MKTRRSRGREAKVQRETLKEEDTSPSSTSLIDNNTSTSVFDEEIISSSTRSCDDGPPSPSESPVNQKLALNSPPDDVGAFFGHPLTRATNALNGEDVDTNANAEALLHEYINLSVIDRDDSKANEKPARFIDAISSKRSDPQLVTTRAVSASSPAAADSPGPGKTNHDGLDPYGKELSEESSQTGESAYIAEYVDIFLGPEFSLDLIDGQAEGHAEARVTTQTRPCAPARAKSRKGVQGTTQQKRAAPTNCQRAPRKSRSKSDAVSSTTNGLSKPEDFQTVTKEFSCPQNLDDLSISSHQFQLKDLPVVSEASTNKQQNSVASVAVTLLPREHELISTSRRSGLTDNADNRLTTPIQLQQHSNQQLTTTTHDQALQTHDQILTVIATSHHNKTISISLSNHVTNATHSSSSVSPTTTASVSTSASASPTQVIPTDISQSAPPLKETNLKKVLSEKIRSRQTTEDTLCPMSANNLKQFMRENVCGMGIENKFSSPMATVKQESPYADLYQHQYLYSPEPASSMVSLTNYSALTLPSYTNAPENVTSVTMASCSDILTSNDSNKNGLNVGTPNSLKNESIDNSGLHHLHNHHSSNQQHQQNHINNMTSIHNMEDQMIVQSSQGQYFQVLQPLQPFDSHSQVTSTDPATNITTNSAGSFYNVYQRDQNYHLLETEKHAAVEHFLHQQHQYTYGAGYAGFLNPDNNYSMKSPDSGYQEPCLSPTSSSAMVLKEMTVTTSNEARKQKAKKKKLSGVGGDPDGAEDREDLIKQCPSSRHDKSHPRSPVIPKLEDNPTGYSYFLETPISTTRHRDDDRVTYVNKSQYYGLSLEFNGQDRTAKYAGVKSVIILAFREEKTMEEEKKAWEYWHGRQHSYKQRILDIDTKNCHGVAPQNIEEVAFNAVAVKWNPTEGPIRVNIAVHCLSTDFSNQKGVKGIPLHIQIDTYEQGPKDSYLVHRGYCQIKAFCDKGAERKTRDEERRKATKGKIEEYGCTPCVPKGRRKTEEVFHDPCDRSEFYSMVNITSPPVFFNPLHENTEFIHKSLSLGVVPSQDEEITSIPSSLQLPDSCDDYYINSPAKRSRRDSCSTPKDQQKVLLYVREQQETAYTALMLEVPTLNGLLKSIEQKFSIAPFKVKNLYKKSRKGILVKLDDNIVRHYSHESTFIIEINLLNDNGDYEIILIELDAMTS